jgi:hypothetical protein
VWPVGLLVLIKAAAEGNFPKRPENGYFCPNRQICAAQHIRGFS